MLPYVMTDAEFRARLAKNPLPKLHSMRWKRRPSPGIGVQGLKKLISEAMKKPESAASAVAPDITIPHNQLPYRHRFSAWAIQTGDVAQEIIDRHEAGIYPTLEEHLAGTSPPSKPFLSPLESWFQSTEEV